MNDPLRTKIRPSEAEQLLADAWVGDSVLELHMRQWVLEHRGLRDMATKDRLTSNAFLTSLGQPSRIEAQIGRIYATEGLAAAREWIDAHLIPAFEKQEANRTRAKRSARSGKH